MNGTYIYRFNGSWWVVEAQFDVTETVISGGLITTSGMTASGTIRIWAGGSNSTLSGATFRVYSDRRIYARNSAASKIRMVLSYAACPATEQIPVP